MARQTPQHPPHSLTHQEAEHARDDIGRALWNARRGDGGPSADVLARCARELYEDQAKRALVSATRGVRWHASADAPLGQMIEKP